MNKEQIEAIKSKAKEDFENEKKSLTQEIIQFGKFDDAFLNKLLRQISLLDFGKDAYDKMYHLESDIKYSPDHVKDKNWSEYFKFKEKIDLSKLMSLCCLDYDRYLDSEPIFFDGDIIITDPCYIIRAEHRGTKPVTKDDWEKCNFGYGMEKLGIYKYMTRDTIYGDWSCTTFNTDTKEIIGEFCADAGLVSVIDLAEVLTYNPDFNYHTEKTWTTTLIKDFKGTVQFVVKHTEGVYDNTTEWHTAGDKWEDFSVVVVGHGVNKVTDKPINFEGRQTGF